MLPGGRVKDDPPRGGRKPRRDDRFLGQSMMATSVPPRVSGMLGTRSNRDYNISFGVAALHSQGPPLYMCGNCAVVCDQPIPPEFVTLVQVANMAQPVYSVLLQDFEVTGVEPKPPAIPKIVAGREA